jgi:hypothetical protein
VVSEGTLEQVVSFSSVEEVRYHALGCKLGDSSLTWHLTGLGVKALMIIG